MNELELLKMKEKNKKIMDNYKMINDKIESIESVLAMKLKNNYDFLNMIETLYNESLDNYHKIAKNFISIN